MLKNAISIITEINRKKKKRKRETERREEKRREKIIQTDP